MSKHAAGIGETRSIPDGLTETDLILGKRAVRISLFLCLVATLALAAMAVYVIRVSLWMPGCLIAGGGAGAGEGFRCRLP